MDKIKLNSIEKENYFIKPVFSLNIVNDFINHLNNESFDKFRDSFFNEIKELEDIKKENITSKYIEKYFNNKVLNPFHKINELNREYFWETQYINIKKEYNVGNSFTELDQNLFLELQKNLINLFNWFEFKELDFSYNKIKYKLNYSEWNIIEKINILEINKNEEKHYFLEINKNEKTLDNIIKITKAIKSNFFWDLYIWNNEEVWKILKENNKNMIHYLSNLINEKVYDKNYKNINQRFNFLVNNDYFKSTWEYLWVKLELINNPLFIEDWKIVLEISDWNISSWFKTFDNLEILIKHLREIDIKNNHKIKEENSELVKNSNFLEDD